MWRKIKQKLQQWRGNLIITPFVAGLIIFGSNLSIFRILEWAVLDQFFSLRWHESVEDRIVIVTIGESDINYIQQWPMADQTMTQMIRNIKAQNPIAIAVDIYRDLPVEPGHQELVREFKTTPNLIGIQKVAGNTIAPPPSLKELNQVAADDLLVDSDGKIRRGIVLLATEDGDVVEGLGTRMALIYLEKEGVEVEVVNEEEQIYRLGEAKIVPLSSDEGEYYEEEMGGYQILVNYRGGLKKFLHISMTDVLNNRIPDNFMRDRLVFIGSKAPSLNNNFSTPYNRILAGSADLFPGVVIHANLTSQIISAALENRPMLRATTKQINRIWIVFWSVYSVVIGSIFIRQRWLTGLLILLAVIVVIMTSYFAFLLGWLVPVFTPLLTIWIASISSIGLVLWQNLMLSYSKLEDYAHNLEKKVKERTAELAQANNEITSLNKKLKQENLRMGAELDVARQLQLMVFPAKLITEILPEN